MRHASATSVGIRCGNGSLQLTITNDGVSGPVADTQGTGIAGLHCFATVNGNIMPPVMMTPSPSRPAYRCPIRSNT